MKRPKGSVGIESNNGRLRLRLPRHIFQGRQIYLYLNLADTKPNRRIAQAKAQQIESDIVLERFDPTLAKYKPPTYNAPELPLPPQLSLRELWQEYTTFKTKSLSPSSLKDFKKVANHISRLPTNSHKDAKAIAAHLTDTLSANAARRVLVQLNACCEWALSRDLIDKNFFVGLTRRVKVTKNHSINPFTATERDLIIKTFEETPAHQHYAAFVKFLFFTGCRTSEAVGLLWEHIDLEFTAITFQEAVVEGKRQTTTKTHKIRKFPINPFLKGLLVELKLNAKPKAPVFTDSQGGLIRPNNFLRRHWQPVVKSLPIGYRPQYNTRHTFITLCLDAQVPINQIAAWVGNSPQIILSHYAGLTRSSVPDL